MSAEEIAEVEVPDNFNPEDFALPGQTVVCVDDEGTETLLEGDVYEVALIVTNVMDPDQTGYILKPRRKTDDVWGSVTYPHIHDFGRFQKVELRTETRVVVVE